jgi:ketosteroid isomerase-like protein
MEGYVLAQGERVATLELAGLARDIREHSGWRSSRHAEIINDQGRERGCLGVVAILTGSEWTGASAMAASEQDRQQITALIEQYRRGFAAMDVEGLKAIWDQDYDNILSIPQEKPQPVRGWAGVEQYYESVARLFERVMTMTVSDVSLDVFGDVAYAYCVFHFEGEMQGQRHVADGRDTFILRRKSGIWKVIHYHESRPGPVAVIEAGESR